MTTEIIWADGWESASYELLFRLYREFGIPPSDIPFLDLETRRFEAAAFS